MSLRLRPLWDRLSPVMEGLSPVRRKFRWLAVLTAVSVFMMVLLTYTRSHSLGALGWLGPWAPPGNGSSVRECSLLCLEARGDDPMWRPRPVPMEHACSVLATLPVPCVANASNSEILEMPPIRFLPNYRNPCWLEDLPPIPAPSPAANSTPPDAVPANNPYYSRNLFACFSRPMRRLFQEITHEYLERQQKTVGKEEGGGGGGGRSGRGLQRLRCLPYFYIAGMPKSGSTDLFRKVMQHPDVVRPPFKEPHWWSKNRFGMRLNYSSAIAISDYIDLFDNAAHHIQNRRQFDNDVDDDVVWSQKNDDVSTGFHPAVTGDASASTFWNNDEWWRLPENCGLTEPRFTNAHHIHRLTPSARVIVILRNPTDRLFSDYLYFTKANKSAESFHQEVVWSIEKLRSCMATQTLRACIYNKQVANGKAKVRLRVGVYHIYLSEWLKVFPADQVMVLRTEDYSRDIRHAIRRVFRFLKLRPLRRHEEEQVIDLPIANTRRLKDRDVGPMWSQTRQTLQDFYQPHNQLLASLLGDPGFLWNDVTTPSTKSHDVTPSSPTADGEKRGANRVKAEKSGEDGEEDEDRTSPSDDSTTPNDVTEEMSNDVKTESDDDDDDDNDEHEDAVSVTMYSSTSTTSAQDVGTDDYSTVSDVEQ